MTDVLGFPVPAAEPLFLGALAVHVRRGRTAAALSELLERPVRS
jgi:hypothetical protein